MSQVVGEGTYGCVHNPSLTCAEEHPAEFYQNKLSKYMKNRHANVELKEYENIGKIDPEHKYYLGKPTKCGVGFTEKNVKSIRKCRYTKKHKNFVNKIGHYALLILPNGGSDLKFWSEKMRKMTSTMENRRSVRRFFFEAQRLFQGIIHFQKNGILHHDIKPANIVYNEKLGRCNFIDFGLMTKISTIMDESRNSDNSFAEYAFWSYPLELIFYNKKMFDRYAVLTLNEKLAIYRRILEDYNLNRSTKTADALHVFFGYITQFIGEEESAAMLNRYMTGFMQTFTKYVVAGMYEKFLEKTVKSIDTYCLGFSLMYCLNSSRHLMSTQVYNMMYECFYSMYDGNLDKRISSHGAYSKYVKILKYWKTLKDKSRTRLTPPSKITVDKDIVKIEMNTEKRLDLLR